MRPARELALSLFAQAVARASPSSAVSGALSCDGDALVVAGERLDGFDRVAVLSLGKAAGPMADAALGALGDLVGEALVIAPRGGVLPGSPRVRVHLSAHPVPDQASLDAGEAALSLASSLGPRDLLLVLLSGGASSLAEAPAHGLSLAEVQGTFEALLRSGAPIGEVNAARKRLSRLKGGGLAAATPARMRTLVLCDVVSGEIDAVGSGPSLPDRSSDEAARAALTRARPGLPARVAALLDRGELLARPRVDPDRCRAAVVADLASSVDEAARAARREGLEALVLTSTLEGEAREAGRFVAEIARECARRCTPATPPCCLLLGGETTVTVRGGGRGGRNQELALAAALAIEGEGGVIIASLATDGIDGPTDAAGAIVDGGTASRIAAAGLSPRACLDDNDAFRALSASGDLVRTGPTGTNVNDLVIAIVTR